MKNNMLSNVKVGDKLWSIKLGECAVVGVYLGQGGLIKVEGVCGTQEYYTEEGKLFEDDAFPSLFFSKPFDKLPPAPVKQYPVDTLVEITYCNKTFKRYLKEVTKEGYARVFIDGASSKTTTSGMATVYKEWRVAE